MDKSMNTVLRELYLDYRNNYLSVELLAEHNAISNELAHELIKAGKQLHEEYVQLVNAKLQSK